MRNINFGLDVPPEVIENAFMQPNVVCAEAFACPMDLSPEWLTMPLKTSLTEANYRPQLTIKTGKVE